MTSGQWKPKPRKALAQMSKKTRQRVKDYRQATFERWGKKCFLCERELPERYLDCHHILGRTNGDDVENIVPLCNRFSGCKAHNHSGKDKRFYELQELILRKKGQKMINMDIESPTMKSLRKLIQKHKEQEQAKIDREIMEIVLKGNNK